MRDRVWAGMHELATLAGTGAGYRIAGRCGSITVSEMGVPHPWSLNAVAGPSLPPHEDLVDAVAWLTEHDRGWGWRVSVPPAVTDDVAKRLGLAVDDALPLYGMPGATARALLAPVPPDVDIDLSTDLDLIRAAYGAWMDDRPLADLLVSASDVANPHRAFLVARVGGAPIGCALVWWVAGTGYLSGIGIVPEQQRRGYGRALTAEATRLAGRGTVDVPAPDVVWMGATPAGGSLYSGMGFAHVDDEVRLGPRRWPACSYRSTPSCSRSRIFVSTPNA